MPISEPMFIIQFGIGTLGSRALKLYTVCPVCQEPHGEWLAPKSVKILSLVGEFIIACDSIILA